MKNEAITLQIERLEHRLTLRGLRVERVPGSIPGATGMLVQRMNGKALAEPLSEELAAAARLWTLLLDLLGDNLTLEKFRTFGGDTCRELVKRKLTEAPGYRIDPVCFVDDEAIKSFAREQFGNMPLSVIDAIADMSPEVQRLRVALTEVSQCLDGLGGDITRERVIGSNVDYVARARYVADVALGKRVEFPGEAHLLSEEGAYRYGYSAAMRGFSIEYPSNVRINAEKTGWTDGYCAGKRAREAMLKGMAPTQLNGRILVPTIAGYSPSTFKAVWRDERAGKDYTEVPTSGTQPAAQRYWVYHLTDTRPGSVCDLSHNHELLDVQRDPVQTATLFATPAQTCEYRLVAEVEAVELDDVFKLTNTIEQHWWLNPEVQAKFPAAGCRSTSAGDIVLDAAGMAYFCDPFGWIDLGPLEPANPATSI